GLPDLVEVPVEEIEHRGVACHLEHELAEGPEAEEAERPVLERHAQVVLGGTDRGGEVVVPEETHLLLQAARGRLHHALDPPRAERREPVGIVVGLAGSLGAAARYRDQPRDRPGVAVAEVLRDVLGARPESRPVEPGDLVLLPPEGHRRGPAVTRTAASAKGTIRERRRVGSGRPMRWTGPGSETKVPPRR